jgi:hypothetical protein
MHKLWLRAAWVAVFAFVSASVFSAYLKPQMLVEFANLVLCS